MVPGAGLEPAQPCGRGILSPLCLPIPPSGHVRKRISQLFFSFSRTLRTRMLCQRLVQCGNCPCVLHANHGGNVVHMKRFKALVNKQQPSFHSGRHVLAESFPQRRKIFRRIALKSALHHQSLPHGSIVNMLSAPLCQQRLHPPHERALDIQQIMIAQTVIIRKMPKHFTLKSVHTGMPVPFYTMPHSTVNHCMAVYKRKVGTISGSAPTV